MERIEEPSSGRGIPVTFAVARRNGQRGLVVLNWVLSIEAAPSAAPGGNGNDVVDSESDVDVKRGTVYFVTDEVSQTFVVKVRTVVCFAKSMSSGPSNLEQLVFDDAKLFFD